MHVLNNARLVFQTFSFLCVNKSPPNGENSVGHLKILVYYFQTKFLIWQAKWSVVFFYLFDVAFISP